MSLSADQEIQSSRNTHATRLRLSHDNGSTCVLIRNQESILLGICPSAKSTLCCHALQDACIVTFSAPDILVVGLHLPSPHSCSLFHRCYLTVYSTFLPQNAFVFAQANSCMSYCMSFPHAVLEPIRGKQLRRCRQAAAGGCAR